MLKVMIVDDEKRTIEGIRSCIDWVANGLEWVGQAGDGQQALELIRQVQPDIVLSDVRMPRMDGISLSERVRSEFPEIKMIFISGHSDIQFIKAAFKNDVTDYILKPVDPEELDAVVKKVADRCRMERSLKKSRDDLELKVHQSLPLLQAKFLSQLISDNITRPDEIFERISFLDIDLPPQGTYWVLVLSHDDYYQFESKTSGFEKELMAFSICNIASDILHEQANGVVFPFKDREFVGIVNFPSDKAETATHETIESMTQTLQEKMNIYLNLSLTIGVGERVSQIERISSSYKSAAEAVNRKLLLGKNKVIFRHELFQADEDKIVMDHIDQDRLYLELKHGNFKTIKPQIQLLFEKITFTQKLDRQIVLNLCLHLFSVANRVEFEQGSKGSADLMNLCQTYDLLFQQETLQDFERYVLSVFDRICTGIQHLQSQSSNKVVEDIKRIIKARYAEDLTINAIAREIFMTPSYICMLFKQETGETINAYLTQYRMEQAKILLHDPKAKLTEICRSVGYADAKYFSKTFKKYTGVNPSEYR